MSAAITLDRSTCRLLQLSLIDIKVECSSGYLSCAKVGEWNFKNQDKMGTKKLLEIGGWILISDSFTEITNKILNLSMRNYDERKILATEYCKYLKTKEEIGNDDDVWVFGDTDTWRNHTQFTVCKNWSIREKWMTCNGKQYEQIHKKTCWKVLGFANDVKGHRALFAPIGTNFWMTWINGYLVIIQKQEVIPCTWFHQALQNGDHLSLEL